MSDYRRLVGGTIVTGDPHQAPIADGEVAFDHDGVITYVGPRRGPVAADDVDLTGHIVMPGLVNTHTHSAMSLLRGTCDDADLHTWLGQVQSVEQGLTHEDLVVGLRLAMAEMIRSGTTTFADMYFWDETLLGAVVDAGMRVVASPAMFDFDSVGFAQVSPMTGREALDHTENLSRDFAGEQRVRLRFGPHATYTCSPQMLAEVSRRAERADLGVHIHLSESAHEVERCLAEYGQTPIALAAANGVLDVPAIAAHAVHATSDDIAILAAHKTAVAHNPVSNLKLGSGVAPLPELLAAGLTVGLGTDGVASNNSLDLFEEIKTAAILQRGVHEQPDIVTSADALTMATAHGAAAVGFPEAGVLAEGRWADVIALRTDTPHSTPHLSPTSFLAFAARGSDVRHVFVAGQRLLDDGVLTTLDEEEVRAAADQTAARLHQS